MTGSMVSPRQQLTHRVGAWLLALGGLLAAVGLWWPSGSASNQSVTVASPVVVIDPTTLSPAAHNLTIMVPTGAVAGLVPARDAAAFVDGVAWARIEGATSVQENPGQSVGTASAVDLWRGAGPVTESKQLAWAESDGAASEHLVALLVRNGTGSYDVPLGWTHAASRGSAPVLILGVLALLAGLVARFRPALVAGLLPGGSPVSSGEPRGHQGNDKDGNDKNDDDKNDNDKNDNDNDKDDDSHDEPPAPRPVTPASAKDAETGTLPFRRRTGPLQHRTAHRRGLTLGAWGLCVAGIATGLAGCSGDSSSGAASSRAASASSSTGASASPSLATPSSLSSSSASASSANASASVDALGQRVDSWGYPLVDQRQASGIVTAINDALGAVQTKRQTAAAEGRLGGPALDVISARLVVSGQNTSAVAAPSALTTQWLALPTATQWPRWFAVAGRTGSGERAQTPSLRVLASGAARQPYGLWADLAMVPGATLPQVTQGAPLLPSDASGLVMSPKDVAIRYADVLNRGDKSDFAASFPMDSFRSQLNARLAADRKRIMTPEIASLTSTHAPSTAHRPMAVRTADGGALVIVTLDHEYRATISAGSRTVHVDAELAALAGRSDFEKELVRRSVEVLAFVVPPAVKSTSGGSAATPALVAAERADVGVTGS